MPLSLQSHPHTSPRTVLFGDHLIKATGLLKFPKQRGNHLVLRDAISISILAENFKRSKKKRSNFVTPVLCGFQAHCSFPFLPPAPTYVSYSGLALHSWLWPYLALWRLFFVISFDSQLHLSLVWNFPVGKQHWLFWFAQHLSSLLLKSEASFGFETPPHSLHVVQSF